MPYSTGQQGLPGNYKLIKSEYVKQEQRAEVEMKMGNTARQSFDAPENNLQREKSQFGRMSGSDVNDHHLLRKRLHGQYKV